MPIKFQINNKNLYQTICVKKRILLNNSNMPRILSVIKVALKKSFT